jgi:large subunit ribosomal protein L24e
MPQFYSCDFCGRQIPPGTGTSLVRRDGRILRFCSGKCRKSMINLKRDPRKLKWTLKYRR